MTPLDVDSKVKAKILSLPDVSGVYVMKDAEGQILYIGKALSLKKRVRSYLIRHAEIPKIPILMSKVREVDYLETPTEVDALLLEAKLIREYQPRYNKELKDDKSFPLIKITKEKFPRILITRNKNDKRAFYYGPFTDAKLLREAVALVHALFPLRKCRRLPKAACLYYHIGQCLAPCIKPSIHDEYARLVDEVRRFIGGGKASFIEYLTARMRESAEELRFEDAEYFKQQICALSRLKKKRFYLKPSGGEGIGLSATAALKQMLCMDKLPEKVVCFDVSNIQGEEAVASKVSFYRELPNKLEYRRYKIRTVKGIDDYAMIQEALGRMLQGLKTGKENFIPDVIMIDGGLGHLHAAEEVFRSEGFETTGLISIAKKFETVYSAKSGKEVPIPKDHSALYLLQKIRDEAHRFAISYHRLLKQKNLRESVLDGIPGIGKTRKQALLANFDSMEELKRAGVDQLAGIPHLDRGSAEKVWSFFHP